MKIASAKTPERTLELIEIQRDRAAELALKHQSKPKGFFTGLAELRAAKAAEAKANSYQRKIDKLIKKCPELAPKEPGAPGATPADRLTALKRLHDQGILSDAEYEQKRSRLVEDL